MHRVEHPNHAKFLTFSCYKRLPLFSNPRARDLFSEHLEAARVKFGFHLYAWVVMPEHVHLLLWPRLPDVPVSTVLSCLKSDIAKITLGRWRQTHASILQQLTLDDGSVRFWQRGGGHDRNIYSREEFEEKVHYIHNNPVERGLVQRPAEWAWSSARWYDGDRTGSVTLDPTPPQRPL
jgi:putative transposase